MPKQTTKRRSGVRAAPTKQPAEAVGIEELTTAVQQVANLIGGLTDRLALLEDQVKGQQAQAASVGHIPKAENPEDSVRAVLGRVHAVDEMAGSSRTIDLLNPRAHLEGFLNDDVVKLKEGSEVARRIKASGSFKGDPDAPIVGTVLSFLYTTKKGQKKYRVQFPGAGKNGCLESELELVRSAV